MSYVKIPEDDLQTEILKVRDRILDTVVAPLPTLTTTNVSATAQACILVWASLLRLVDPEITREQMLKVATAVIDTYFQNRSH